MIPVPHIPQPICLPLTDNWGFVLALDNKRDPGSSDLMETMCLQLLNKQCYEFNVTWKLFTGRNYIQAHIQGKNSHRNFAHGSAFTSVMCQE